MQADRTPINGLSHVVGDTGPALLDHTIPQLLAQAVANHPDREAAVFPQQNIRWNYAEFGRQVDRD